MAKIKIQNFGPIKKGCVENDGWLDIRKITLFIGNQGSGKSTAAKLISTFTWMEKALVRGDYDIGWFERKGRLKSLLKYHRLDNYFKSNGGGETIIDYEGDAYSIKYHKDTITVQEHTGNRYSLPQLMYVPAERNFISYVKTPKELRLSSESLKDFLTEFENSKNWMKGTVPVLPVNGVGLEYDKLNDTLNLKGADFRVKLPEASSGFQSLVPLYLVSEFLAKKVQTESYSRTEEMSVEERQRFRKEVEAILNNNDLTPEQKKLALSAQSSKFNKTAFINIVEEPEQNLYPASQWEILKFLLELSHINDGNKLIITTHSPYMLNFMSIVMYGSSIKTKVSISPSSQELLTRLFQIVPYQCMFRWEKAPIEDQVAIYQMNEVDGSIQFLSMIEGIPSDRNYLNDFLAAGNRLFDQLLEIEQEV